VVTLDLALHMLGHTQGQYSLLISGHIFCSTGQTHCRGLPFLLFSAVIFFTVVFSSPTEVVLFSSRAHTLSGMLSTASSNMIDVVCKTTHTSLKLRQSAEAKC